MMLSRAMLSVRPVACRGSRNRGAVFSQFLNNFNTSLQIKHSFPVVSDSSQHRNPPLDRHSSKWNLDTNKVTFFPHSIQYANIMNSAIATRTLSRCPLLRSISSTASNHKNDGCWALYCGVPVEVLEIIGHMARVRLYGSFKQKYIPYTHLQKSNVPPVAVGDRVVIAVGNGQHGDTVQKNYTTDDMKGIGEESGLVLSRWHSGSNGVMFDVLVLSLDGSCKIRVVSQSHVLRKVSYTDFPALEDITITSWLNNLSTPPLLGPITVSFHRDKKGNYRVILTVCWRQDSMIKMATVTFYNSKVVHACVIVPKQPRGHGDFSR